MCVIISCEQCANLSVGLLLQWFYILLVGKNSNNEIWCFKAMNYASTYYSHVALNILAELGGFFKCGAHEI